MRRTVAGCLLICSCLSALSQTIPRADAITFIGSEQFAPMAVKTVFSIHRADDYNKPTTPPLATGFLVTRESATNEVWGVTVAHAIEPSAKFVAGISVSNEVRYIPLIPAHVDQELDAAVCWLRNPPSGPVKADQLGVAPNLGGANELIREGRGLMTVGYPLSRGQEPIEQEGAITIVNKPVVRIGIVAQSPVGSTFLMDGVASPGNSGSPVFDLQSMHVVGMLKGFHNESMVLKDQANRVVAQLPYNSGLALATTYQALLEAIDRAERLQKSPSPTAGSQNEHSQSDPE